MQSSFHCMFNSFYGKNKEKQLPRNQYCQSQENAFQKHVSQRQAETFNRSVYLSRRSRVSAWSVVAQYGPRSCCCQQR